MAPGLVARSRANRGKFKGQMIRTRYTLRSDATALLSIMTRQASRGATAGSRVLPIVEHSVTKLTARIQSVPAWCQRVAGVRVSFRHFRSDAGTEVRGKYG
jgi:hypothetical protein